MSTDSITKVVNYYRRNIKPQRLVCNDTNSLLNVGHLHYGQCKQSSFIQQQSQQRNLLRRLSIYCEGNIRFDMVS